MRRAARTLTSIAFLGTSVESGAASAVVVATGKETYLGGMAESLQEQPPRRPSIAASRGSPGCMLRFMVVMVPLVFVINGLTKGNWTQAFFFAVAVAVGLTPEMLPMIVTVCLSKGAVAMGKKKVIVKRINAIQNLGAMDVLCTDKTGTLTMDRVVLERTATSCCARTTACSRWPTSTATFRPASRTSSTARCWRTRRRTRRRAIPELTKVDEIPFDFERRIMSVVVRTPEGNDRIISKGAPEAIFPTLRELRARRQGLADGPPTSRS